MKPQIQMITTVRWGDKEIPYAEAKAKAEAAKELAKGINLLTTENRTWYEDSWTETVSNWFGVAQLIDRVKEQP